MLTAELDRVRKRYGDTRVSVLGFKARIMKLTGDLEQMRGTRGSSDVQQVGVAGHMTGHMTVSHMCM